MRPNANSSSLFIPSSSQQSLFSLSTPRHSAPQCCLVSLIQLNRLKTNLQQLKQYIFKQLHTMNNGLSLIGIGYESIANQNETRNKSHSKSKDKLKSSPRKMVVKEKNKEFQSKSVMEIERDIDIQHRDKMENKQLSELRNKLSQYQKLNKNNEVLIKKQNECIKILRTENQLSKENMNDKINELYSIIKTKNEEIERVNRQLNQLKRVNQSSRKSKDNSIEKKKESKYLMMGMRKSIETKRNSSRDNSKQTNVSKQKPMNLKVTKKYHPGNNSNSKSSFKSPSPSHSTSISKYHNNEHQQSILKSNRQSISSSRQSITKTNNYLPPLPPSLSTPLRQISFSTEMADKIGEIVCSITDETGVRVKELKGISLDNSYCLRKSEKKIEKKVSVKKEDKPPLKQNSVNEAYKSAMKSFSKFERLKLFK